MSFNRREDGQAVGHPYNGVPLSNKKECLSSLRTTGITQVRFAKFKKSDVKGYILYMPFLGQSGKRKITVGKTEKWLQGIGHGGVMCYEGGTLGNSEGVGAVLWGTG